MTTADLTALIAFTEALPEDRPVGIQGVEITRDQMIEACNEIIEARDRYAEGADVDGEGELVTLIAMRDELIAYLEQYGDDVDPELVAIVHGPQEEEAGPGEAGVGQMQAALAMLGAPNVSPESAAALLQFAATLAAQETAPMPAPAPQPVRRVRPVQQAAPAPAPARRVVKAVPTPRAAIHNARDRPGAPIRYPTPANPPPFKEVTAEELFGLTRGQNGRFDSGGLG